MAERLKSILSNADRIGGMVTLEQLWSRSELALDVIVDSPTAAVQDVTIVHSSELPEVDEWLAGGEVLLTIGVGQDLGADTVGDYVRRLKTVGVHALGIGLGSDLPWQEVPDSLIAHAEAVGLAVFGVPEPVPFVAVVDAFTRMREAETNRELTRASSAARRFANALAHQGSAALVTDLAETLDAEVRFVSPTGRALTGEDAEDDVRAALIEEYLTPTLSPRLIRTGSRIIEAVPLGSDHPLGWILTPAEAAGSPKTRALLLSTAAALLAMTLSDLPVLTGYSRLFESELSAEEKRAEWTRVTGAAPVATMDVRFFGGVRGDTAEHLIADIVGASLLTRAGSLLGVAGAGDLGLSDLVTKAAEAPGSNLWQRSGSLWGRSTTHGCCGGLSTKPRPPKSRHCCRRSMKKPRTVSSIGCSVNSSGRGAGRSCWRRCEPISLRPGRRRPLPQNSESTGTRFGLGWRRSRSCWVGTSPAPRPSRRYRSRSNSPNSDNRCCHGPNRCARWSATQTLGQPQQTLSEPQRSVRRGISRRSRERGPALRLRRC
jgi:purine catabolism regulator